MNWLNIKEVLSPETIRVILNKHEISMVRYYPKPRKTTSYTTILIEVLNKNKEIVPTIIVVCESINDFNKEKQISIGQRVIRNKDRLIFSREEMKNLGITFELLGLKVWV